MTARFRFAEILLYGTHLCCNLNAGFFRSAPLLLAHETGGSWIVINPPEYLYKEISLYQQEQQRGHKHQPEQ
jgi:hypothetical protein